MSGEHGELTADGSVRGIAAACTRVLGRTFATALLRKRAKSFSRARFRRRFTYLLERVLPDKYHG